MAARKITIVFLPDASKKVRRLKIPKSLLFFFFLIFLSAALTLTWGIRDYRAIKAKIPRLAQLEEENAQQRIQLIALTQKIDQISGKLIELKKFDQKLKNMVNLETSEDNTQFLGIGGSDPSLLNPDYTLEKAHQKLVRLMHQSLDNLNTEISIQTNEKAELCKFLDNQKIMLACTPSIWPTRGWLSSGFGYRISPFTNEKEFHKGIDISTRMNTPVLAPADGVISSTGRDHAMGNMLTINHSYGMKTRYGHLSKTLVKKGQYVKRGQKIGLVGKSGRTTGPHLHYEVYLNGLPVNPLRHILN
ncbi:MAG: M23 family metallopeptidase [Deltaproteobacteria bacterium]|nr:MAG: M23 family metallopeptidase [Deltaproteobacteria bacterium]